jgi:hypothetical protein
MAKKKELKPQNPLVLQAHRLMEAFSKSDDERDYYLNDLEGYIVFVDLNKDQVELDALYKAIKKDEHFRLIPKLSFYESKKIMEGFVHEKVYDIDTKEKLIEIIQSKEARENFLDFLYDHHVELEKWLQFYLERGRVRIIEWLRKHFLHFVFEEDLDLAQGLIEKVKKNLFTEKVAKDIADARKTLVAKSKTYYSSEALNPRPKRGRPPKQTTKLEIEPQFSLDFYSTPSAAIRPFLFVPKPASSLGLNFSSKYDSEEELLAQRNQQMTSSESALISLNNKLQSLRNMTKSSNPIALSVSAAPKPAPKAKAKIAPAAAPKAPPKKAVAVKKKPAAPVKKAAPKVKKAETVKEGEAPKKKRRTQLTRLTRTKKRKTSEK